MRLESRDDAQSLYELQSGLTGPEGAEYPTHLATYVSPKADYALDGAKEHQRAAHLERGRCDGHQNLRLPPRAVPHRSRLHRAQRRQRSRPARQYAQILREDPPTKRSYFDVTSYAFHGPALWDGTSSAASTSPTRRTVVSRSKCATAGWRPCSTTS